MKRTKRMRLPNGFGQISFLKGNHRKPYRVMVTVGTNDYGRPICKILKPQGYFETYNDAYMALMEYHKNPIDLTKITFGEIFQKWSVESFPRLQNNTIVFYKTAWNRLSSISDKPITKYKSKELKELLMSEKFTASSAKSTKTLLTQLYDYAVENEYVDKNYARNINMKNKNYSVIKGHKSFTEEEMKILWSNSNISEVIPILIQCYTGLRPNELCNIKLENISIENGYITGGSKTKAGTDRIIPIHDSIKPFIEELINKAEENHSNYLILNKNCTKIDYQQYHNSFKLIINRLGLNQEHSTHDCRKYFITTAKECNLNEYAIKLIVGHQISDITERIYTERSLERLKSEMRKIKVYEYCTSNV